MLTGIIVIKDSLDTITPSVWSSDATATSLLENSFSHFSLEVLVIWINTLDGWQVCESDRPDGTYSPF